MHWWKIEAANNSSFVKLPLLADIILTAWSRILVENAGANRGWKGANESGVVRNSMGEVTIERGQQNVKGSK